MLRLFTVCRRTAGTAAELTHALATPQRRLVLRPVGNPLPPRPCPAKKFSPVRPRRCPCALPRLSPLRLIDSSNRLSHLPTLSPLLPKSPPVNIPVDSPASRLLGFSPRLLTQLPIPYPPCSIPCRFPPSPYDLAPSPSILPGHKTASCRESHSRPARHRPASLRAGPNAKRSTLTGKASTRPLARTPANLIRGPANQIFIATRTFTNPPKSCTTRSSFRSAFRLLTARRNSETTMTNRATTETGTREWQARVAHRACPERSEGSRLCESGRASHPLRLRNWIPDTGAHAWATPWRPFPLPRSSAAPQRLRVALCLPNPEPRAPTPDPIAALCRESAAFLPPAATPNSLSQGISKGSWTKSPHAIAAFSKITKSGRKRQSHQASGLSFPARFWPSRVIAYDLPPASSGGEAFVSSCLRSLPRAVARGALRVEMARVPAISDLFRLLPTPFRSVADPIFPHSPLPVPHSPKSARLFAENHENAFFGNFRQLRRTFRGARSRPQCCVLHPPLARFGAAEPCGTWPRWRPQPFRLSTLHSLGGAADHIAALAAIGNPIGTPQTALPAPPAHLPAESRRGIADSAFFTKIGTFRRPIPIGAL